MKFKQYLNEITKLSDEEVDIIVNTIFSDFERGMKKVRFKFWPVIFGILSSSTKQFKIKIIPKFFTKVGNLKRFSSSSGITDKLGGISIFLTTDDFRSLKSSGGINKMKNRFRETISHELIHRKQFEKIKKGKANKTDFKNLVDYYSDKAEIEAYARSAIEELRRGTSDILSTYTLIVKSENDEAWKRFLKKLYQYIDMSPDSSELKNMLYNQLKNFKMSRLLKDLEDILGGME